MRGSSPMFKMSQDKWSFYVNFLYSYPLPRDKTLKLEYPSEGWYNNSETQTTSLIMAFQYPEKFYIN